MGSRRAVRLAPADSFDIASVGSLLIYECHVGMAQEKEGVGTYCEFIKTILPHIKKAGYNTIQLMAVANTPITAVSDTMSAIFSPRRRASALRKN